MLILITLAIWYDIIPTYSTFITVTGEGSLSVTGDPQYARYIYDDLAERFETRLVDTLEYRGPWILKEMLMSHVSSSHDPSSVSINVGSEYRPSSSMPIWRALDLGCGSGLCGKVFGDMIFPGHSPLHPRTSPILDRGDWMDSVERVLVEEQEEPLLIGVDVSERIAELAVATGRYTCVIVTDLKSVLSYMTDVLHRNRRESHAIETLPAARLSSASPPNLVIAADTFIYVGALGSVFALLSRVLPVGGYFLFTVEALEGSPMLPSETADLCPPPPGKEQEGEDATHATIRVGAGTVEESNYDVEIEGAVPGWGARLLSSARFAHSDRYIRELCDRHKFSVVVYRGIMLRVEGTVPLPGHAYVLQLTSSPCLPP